MIARKFTEEFDKALRDTPDTIHHRLQFHLRVGTFDQPRLKRTARATMRKAHAHTGSFERHFGKYPSSTLKEDVIPEDFMIIISVKENIFTTTIPRWKT